MTINNNRYRANIIMIHYCKESISKVYVSLYMVEGENIYIYSSLNVMCVSVGGVIFKLCFFPNVSKVNRHF